jgi:hypothetical protein
MSAYNMETLEKSDRINYIRDAFKKAMKEQSKFMTASTVNARWLKFNSKKVYNSRPKIIKLYNEIWEHKEDVKSLSDIKKIKKQIKEQNSKIKAVVGNRTKYDKKALGDIFKKSFFTDFEDQTIDYMRYAYNNRINSNDFGLKTAKKYSWNNSARILSGCIIK